MEEIIQVQRNIAGVHPDTIFTIFGYPFANSTLMLFIVIGLIIIGAIILNKTFKKIPSGFQNIVEYLYENIIKMLTQITGSIRISEGVFPLVGTLFIFIFMSNFIGLIPGISSVTYHGLNIFRTPTSDFNTTFALAFAMVLFLQLVSIKEWGFFTHIGKFIQIHEIFKGFRQGIGAGFQALVNFFIGLLDIIGECAKVISLSLRLFGNMYAGEVLATVIMAGVSFVLPAIWMGMSMLSAVVQTLVFSLLITAYYSLTLKPTPQEKNVMNKP